MGCTLNTIINTKETPRALSHTYQSDTQPNQKSISEQVQNAGQKEKGFTIDAKEKRHQF